MGSVYVRGKQWQRELSWVGDIPADLFLSDAWQDEEIYETPYPSIKRGVGPHRCVELYFDTAEDPVQIWIEVIDAGDREWWSDRNVNSDDCLANVWLTDVNEAQQLADLLDNLSSLRTPLPLALERPDLVVFLLATGLIEPLKLLPWLSNAESRMAVLTSQAGECPAQTRQP